MSQLLEQTCIRKNCGYSDTIRFAPDEINPKCSEGVHITGLEKNHPLKCEECLYNVITEWGGGCPKCGGRFEKSYKTAKKYEQMSRGNIHIRYTHGG